MVKTQLLIDGNWRPAGDGQTFAVHDPATEQVLGHVANASAADALDAVAAAASAQPAWGARSPRQRGEVLRRAFELMIERRDGIARLIVQENRSEERRVGKECRDRWVRVD